MSAAGMSPPSPGGHQRLLAEGKSAGIVHGGILLEHSGHFHSQLVGWNLVPRPHSPQWRLMEDSWLDARACRFPLRLHTQTERALSPRACSFASVFLLTGRAAPLRLGCEDGSPPALWLPVWTHFQHPIDKVHHPNCLLNPCPSYSHSHGCN